MFKDYVNVRSWVVKKSLKTQIDRKYRLVIFHWLRCKKIQSLRAIFKL